MKIAIGAVIVAVLAASFILELGNNIWWTMGKIAAGIIVLALAGKPPRRRQEDPFFQLCEDRA